MAIHGIEIDRITGGVRPVETIEGGAIGLLASFDGGETSVTEGDLVLIRSATDVVINGETSVSLADIDDGSGTIGPIFDLIRKQGTSAPLIVVAVDPENIVANPEATPDPYLGPIGSAASFTHAFRLLQAEAVCGVRPRFLCQALVPAIGSDLIAVANRLLARVYLDGPNTNDAAAISDVEGFAGERVLYSDPAVITDADDEVGQSVIWAAISSRINFWESPSNKTIVGIKGLSRPVSFAMGDANAQAQLLLDANVNTIIRKQGWRTWGGYSLATDPNFKQINVGSTDDVIAESIQEAFLWAVDMGITRTFVDDVVGSVQAFLRDLTARGAIIDGDAWADPELNTPTSVAGGNLYIDYDFGPVYAANRIVMRRHLNNEYLRSIFA